jgi:hypothetical protein
MTKNMASGPVYYILYMAQSTYTQMGWHDAALINSQLKAKNNPHA